MEAPYFTVIITAFNRKLFLLDAVKSALNQTLDRKLFEIIVVKNFLDHEIDNYLISNDVRIINSPSFSVGEYLTIGGENSIGTVLCFLDDDDIFTPNKLEYLYKLYKQNVNLGYLHNSFETIDVHGDSIVRKLDKKMKKRTIRLTEPINQKEIRMLLKKRANANMSSISIKKDILIRWKTSLKKIRTNQDTFLLYLAAISKFDIISDKTILSKYRIHESTSHFFGDIDDYIEKSIKFETAILDSYRVINSITKNTSIHNFSKSQYIQTMINLYLLGDESCKPNLKELSLLVSSIWIRRAFFPVVFIINVFITLINPKVGRSIHKIMLSHLT